VAWQELGCSGVKVEFLKGADFPEGLEPIIAAFAVELSAIALENADVAGDVGRRCSVADFEALFCGLVEPARVYIIEQGEDSVDLVSGRAVEGLEDFGDSLLGDSLQRGGWTLELFRCDFGSEFVFEFHRTQLGRVLRPRGSRKEFKLLRLRNGFAARGQAEFGGGYSVGATSGPAVGSWNAV
jgi:hypothetical protein